MGSSHRRGASILEMPIIELTESECAALAAFLRDATVADQGCVGED
jgi:hypothetical protein